MRNMNVTRRIAWQGYYHAMTYHRALNLMDYVFRTVHLKQEYQRLGRLEDLNQYEKVVVNPLGYSYTGYDLRLHALDMQAKVAGRKKGETIHFHK